MKVSVEKDYIKSVSEFITTVFNKIGNLENDKTTDRTIWFRGEDSEKYNLVPNLYRKISKSEIPYCQDILNPKSISTVEQNIDTSFYRKSTAFFAKNRIANTPWNRYFLKQHYGVRTRLLDWTENALFALFFAVSSNSGENGKVWLLSPFKLNNYSLHKLYPSDKNFYTILTCGKLKKKDNLINKNGELRASELLRKYYRLDFSNSEELYPLAIYPPHLDERMSSQQACFTLYGNIVRGLDCNDTQEKFLDCVYIDAVSKFDILKELRVLGISNYSIYPDLDGLGRTINYDHSNDIFLTQEGNDTTNFIEKIILRSQEIE